MTLPSFVDILHAVLVAIGICFTIAVPVIIVTGVSGFSHATHKIWTKFWVGSIRFVLRWAGAIALIWFAQRVMDALN